VRDGQRGVRGDKAARAVDAGAIRSAREKRMTGPTRRLVPACLLVAALGAGAVFAQPPAAGGVTRLLITTYRVKPDHVATWIGLQEDEVVPALKKAGVETRAVYRTVLGETSEFQVRRPISGFEVYDVPSPLQRALGADKAADLEARLAACVESVRVHVENRQNEFFVDPGDAPVQFASKYRALPGKAGAYTVYFRENMLPVFKKAKEDGTFSGLDYTVSQHGGEWGLITLNMYYPDFAPLDGEPPVAKTLGPQRTRELLAKGQGLIDPLEWIVRRRVARLSF
jgi:hypothetical protein